MTRRDVNLPNVITLVRIACAPVVAILPFWPSAGFRLMAFVVYVGAALTDYFDGRLARNRDLVTRLGKMLDPLADKVLLFATLTPMFALMAPADDWVGRGIWWWSGAFTLPFTTPVGPVGLAWWIVAVVVARELLMTIFRQIADRRGVTIAAIGPAKWKTAAQYIWVGSAYFWFFAATLAGQLGWSSAAWRAFAMFNGTVGVLTMIVAVILTVYSLGLYIRRYGGLLVRQPVSH
jgi:phosphatidylglycerophosphate synthase